MAIALMKFHLSIILFNLNLLLYCHGTGTEEQGSGVKQKEQRLKSESDLRAEAKPYYPQPSLMDSWREGKNNLFFTAEAGPSHHNQFNQPSTMHLRQENDERKLPDDHFGMFDSYKQGKTFIKRNIFERDDLSDYWAALERNPILMESFRQQQRQPQQYKGDNWTTEHNQFNEGSRSSNIFGDSGQMKTKTKEAINDHKPLRWDELGYGNFDSIQLFQNILEQREKEGVITRRNKLEDGSSSVARSPVITNWANVVAQGVGQTPAADQQPKQPVGTERDASSDTSKTMHSMYKSNLPDNSSNKADNGSKKHKNKHQKKVKGKKKTAENKQGTDPPQDSPLQIPPDTEIIKKFNHYELVKKEKELPENLYELLPDVKEKSSSLAAQLKPPTAAVIPASISSSVPVDVPSSFDVPDDKRKEVMTDKMKEKESNEKLQTQIRSIVASIQKLKRDKTEFMQSKDDEAAKKEKLFKLTEYYTKIMQNLELFARTNFSMEMEFEIINISTLFDWMNTKKVNKGSMVDKAQLTRIMNESLAYFEEYLRKYNIDILRMFFESVAVLKKNLMKYDGTEEAKAALNESYTKDGSVKLGNVLSYLFIGKFTAKSTKDAVYMGLSELSKVLPSRQYQFLQAKQVLDKYMDIIYGPQEMMTNNQEKSKMNRELEQLRKEKLPEGIQKLITDTEVILDKIKALGEENKKILLTTDHHENRLALKQSMKVNYQYIMELLTNFANDYGKEYKKPTFPDPDIDFFMYTILWIVKIYKYKGLERAEEGNLCTTMKICLSCLQGNEFGEEDLTNFMELVEDIDRLKSEAENCEKLAKNEGGYKNPAVRTMFKQAHDFYLQIEPKLREAFGYVLIGLSGEAGVRLSRKKIRMGLVELSEVAAAKYNNGLDQSLINLNAFYSFSDRAMEEEIRENFTEYVAKVLGKSFDPDVHINLDKLAAKLEYPQIYADGLKAIAEFLNAKELSSAKEGENASNVSSSSAVISSSSSGAGSKKSKKRADEKKTDSIDVNDSNWKTVLKQARKQIRYVHILTQMIQQAEKNVNNTIDQAVYLRVWIRMYSEFALTMHIWMSKYYKMQNMEINKHKSYASIFYKSYADGIFKFFNKNEDTAAKGRQIQEALNHLSQMHFDYNMLHRQLHLLKWLTGQNQNPNCYCTKYDYLTKDL